jgi:hypothetical protein
MQSKIEFANDPDVDEFVSWAQNALRCVQVSLAITRRGTGCAGGTLGPGVNNLNASNRFIGIEAITDAYHWRSQWLDRWTDPSQPTLRISGDWVSTKHTIVCLSNLLRGELLKNDPDGTACLDICTEIVKWGGGRNLAAGAVLFLKGLTKLGYLQKYLIDRAKDFDLDNADLNSLGGTLMMNAMLTKVHALVAEDGLPIYDSRVAGAMGALVELYRQSLSSPWQAIPRFLRFPATEDPFGRRSVNGLNVRAGWVPVLNPGVIIRGNGPRGVARRAIEWSSCKIRLGWLIESILKRAIRDGNPFFVDQPTLHDQMHAFEAALFMIGFDVSCL